MRKVFLLAFFICALPLLAQAQFNSGSNGADGALDLSTMTCPNNICDVQLPESGILNYTTVNVPQGKQLRFIKNSINTPVTLLAQGNVVIQGSIILRTTNPGNYREPGPGGFYGGSFGQNGFGPGGGTSSSPARWVGSLSLVPLIGGSGGWGTNSSSGNGLGLGFGAGGAIVIASSTSINVGSLIHAGGGCGGNCVGAGAGGAVRLVANSIIVSGRVSTHTCDDAFNCGLKGPIRFEAPQGQVTFTGSSDPLAVIAQINPIIIPTNPPTLRIASIGGYAVPSSSAGRGDRVDLMLPTQLTDPISVEIQGANVSSGTQVQLQLSGASGIATGCTLTGGPGPVSCTATVSGLNRAGVSTLLAVAVFTPPALAQTFNPKGQNQVAKVQLEAALGGKSKYVFLRADGSTIETAKVPKEFLQYFGM